MGQRVSFRWWSNKQWVDAYGVFLGWTNYGADNELGAIVGIAGGGIVVVMSESIKFVEEFPDGTLCACCDVG